MKILTAAEMREVDRLTSDRFGIPTLTLMENAGRSVAEFIGTRFGRMPGRRVVSLCGKGNNGGDGFVAARHLLEMGARCEIFLFAAAEEVQGDASANLARLRNSGAEVHIVRDAEAWTAAREA